MFLWTMGNVGKMHRICFLIVQHWISNKVNADGRISFSAINPDVNADYNSSGRKNCHSFQVLLQWRNSSMSLAFKYRTFCPFFGHLETSGFITMEMPDLQRAGFLSDDSCSVLSTRFQSAVVLWLGSYSTGTGQRGCERENSGLWRARHRTYQLCLWGYILTHRHSLIWGIPSGAAV